MMWMGQIVGEHAGLEESILEDLVIYCELFRPV